MTRLLYIIKRFFYYGLIGKPIEAHPVNLLEKCIAEYGIANFFNFDFNAQKQKTLLFIDNMKCSEPFTYKYSSSTTKPNLYASTYVCLLWSLYGELDNLSSEEKSSWVSYFDSFQNDDGFFYDPSILNENYDHSDWWGKRHLLPHIVMAYTALGAKPKYNFEWIKEYYNKDALDSLITAVDWGSAIMDDTDIDNKIMNIGVCLQYQRDFRSDKEAESAITYLEEKLLEKINIETGFWGNYNLCDAAERARMIQFSYHLQRLFFYDKYRFANAERMIDLILESQNKYGGFAAHLNSSACADIDAIDPLIYLSKMTDYRKDDIRKALYRAFIFILSNQNKDGGFVFMRDTPFYYGDKEMSSERNESAMFPTWFRTLSIAYICKYLGLGNYRMTECPGY